MTATQQQDRDEIIEHIHSIFEAFLKQDREALRQTHTKDWTGFQGPSTKIERGIDDYMMNAESSLRHFRGTGYELLDTEVQLYGDVAVVYYVARYEYLDADGQAGSLPLRSIDVYRRDDGHWIQCGSHITPIPTAGSAWGEANRSDRAPAPGRTEPSKIKAIPSLDGVERTELLKARSAVWQAWFGGDRAALHALVPEGAIAIDPGIEQWAARDEIVERARRFVADGGKLIRLEFPETQIQSFGDVAVIYTRYLFEFETAGKRETVSGRGTEIFQKKDGEWTNPGWHLDSGR